MYRAKKVNWGNEKIRYYVYSIMTSLIISTYFGFKFKQYGDKYVLRKASNKGAKWAHDTYLHSKTAGDPFFKLEGYYFNWEWFFISLLILITVLFVVRNTIYYEKIKNYIKRIRR